jgi:hypothetical protein
MTTIEAILHYLVNTKPWILLVHLFYIIMVCMALSAAYVVTFHWGSVFGIYAQAYDLSRFGDNLKTSVQDDSKINSQLENVLNASGGIRAYMYRYHDGLGAVSGVQFFFESATDEVISPGTTRLMNYQQNIPASVDFTTNNQFIQNKCAIITDTTIDPQSQNYFYFQSRGAKAMVRCPIYVDNGDLFGFVGIDFDHTITVAEADVVSGLLQSAAQQIEPLFSTQSIQ